MTTLNKHLTRICELATEIEESPSSMGWEDIERLAELKEEAGKALELLSVTRQRARL